MEETVGSIWYLSKYTKPAEKVFEEVIVPLINNQSDKYEIKVFKGDVTECSFKELERICKENDIYLYHNRESTTVSRTGFGEEEPFYLMRPMITHEGKDFVAFN